MESRPVAPVATPEPKAEPEPEKAPAPSESAAPVAEEEKQGDVPVVEKPAEPEAGEGSEDFATCWSSMFEEVFASNPMIYHPLKDKMPVLEDGVIKVEVQNEFQKNQFEMRKRALLEFWRNHFSINVDDLEVVVNEHMEMKKVIYSAEDKMQNMAEQNPEFVAFLKELSFRMKD